MKELGYSYHELFNPVLKAMKNLGGSGTNEEIESAVAGLLKLTDEEINDLHRGNRSKLNYRLAWSKNYLKNYGLLENTSRGTWSLTKEGHIIEDVDPEVVVKKVKGEQKKSRDISQPEVNEALEDQTDISDEDTVFVWQDELLNILRNMPPKGFEELCQFVLRELGFSNVEVTGRSGDGGIDGAGVVKIGGLLSFHVVFQSKRYTGAVGAPYIRDFRGAMMGRAEKGVVLTTGTFTRDARKEAQRDGAAPIDLVDGDQFANILKDLKLGISIEMVEKVNVDADWFIRFD